MKNSKLIKILKTLSSNELEKLMDFVQSPYFNKKKVIVELCTILSAYHPEFSSQELTKKKLYFNLFPSEDYSEKKIGYTMSDLTKIVLRFLVLQEQEVNNNKLTLARVLVNRDLNQLYKKEIKGILLSFEENKQKGADSYKYKFEVYEEEDKYFIKKNERKDDQNAHDASKNLDLFFICKKLQYFAVLINRSYVFGKEINIPNLEFILSFAKNNFPDTPIVSAYYEIIMLQTKEDSLPHLTALKKIIAKKKSYFSSKELAEIYEEAINYCIQRIKIDQHFYISEALNLYTEFLDSGNLYQNGYLSQWKFKNIIKLGILLERYSWVFDFINDYINKIKPEHREKALNYNFAELHFSMKEYDLAQMYLQKVFLNDLELVYNLGSRMMLIKIFYHNKEEEALLSQLAAFTIFLKRSKNISERKKITYLNFCDLMNKMLRRNPKKYQHIKREIENTKLLTASSWLLEVFHDLQPSKTESKLFYKNGNIRKSTN